MDYNEQLEKKDAIVRRVVDMYLERFPLVPHYGMHLTSSEDDSNETYYHALLDEEIAIIQAWKNNEEGMTLEEYLEECAADDESGKYETLLEEWKEHSSPFPLNILDSCDLDKPLFFTQVDIRRLQEQDKLWYMGHIGMQVSVDEVKQLLFIYIKGHNHITFNQLMYLYPEFSVRLNRHMSWQICDGVCESLYPFILDMVGIKRMVEDICSPEKDVLGLCAMDDTDIRSFLSDYELVPEYETLFEENDGKYSFHVLSYIHGHRLELFQEKVNNADMDDWPIENQYYDADKLCKTLGLDNYQALQDYVKEHFSIKTAFDDFRDWAEKNCPDSILESNGDGI